MSIQIRITFLLFLVCTTSFSQSRLSKAYSIKEGACESKYILDSSGIYFTTVNCNGSLTVDYGQYTSNAKQVNFKSKGFSSLAPIGSIVKGSTENDSISKVTFRARYKKTFLDKAFIVDAIDLTGKTYKRFLPDSNGAIMINFRRFKSLRLNYLDHFYVKRVYVHTSPFDQTIEVNLPKEFFSQQHPLLDPRPGFSLTVKAGELYTAAGKKLTLLVE
jgi:hypothetical protein